MLRYCGIIFYCVIVLYVCCRFSFGNGATTSKVLLMTTKKNETISTGKFPSRTGGKIITLRLGADGSTPREQCECRLFYLCDRGNTIDIPQNGESCRENYVCCKVVTSTLTEGLPMLSSSTYSSSESEPISPSASIIPLDSSDAPSSTATASTDDCRCVPTEQCRRTREEQESGAGGIDQRKTTCNVLEWCCLPKNIITGEDSSLDGLNNIGTTSSPQDSSSDCGMRNTGQDISNRIVSPEHLKNTSFGEFPWMALLLITEIDSTTGKRLDNVFVCGASLVSSKIVLTAGHCVHDVSNINLLKVRVGEYDTHAEANKEQKPHQDRQVLRITQHPSFNAKTLYNDLALLEVVEPFIFDYHVRAICIPLVSSTTYDYNPSNCVATGWGKNAFGPQSQYPTTLKKVDLTIVSNDRCQEELRKTRLGQYFILDRSFICAEGQAGMDTCEVRGLNTLHFYESHHSPSQFFYKMYTHDWESPGDGGGPLVCPLRSNPNKYVQVGIVSWGIGCANGPPAVYGSLERNVDWLTEEINTAQVFSSSVGERKLKTS